MSSEGLTKAAQHCILLSAAWHKPGIHSQAPVAEWYTQQVEGLCSKGRGGSSPLGGTYFLTFVPASGML